MNSAGSGMSAPASLSDPVFPPLRINPELVRRILVGFIRNEVRKVGFERLVLGLSGGGGFPPGGARSAGGPGARQRPGRVCALQNNRPQHTPAPPPASPP